MSYVVFQHHTNTWYYTDGKYKSKWSSNINSAKVFHFMETAMAIAKPFPYAKILEVELSSPKVKERFIGYHI